MRTKSLILALLALASVATLPLSVNAAPAPDANSVLILDPTVTGGMSSIEAQKAIAQGKTVVTVSPLTWSLMTTTDFQSYRALILGDPTCGGIGTSPWLDAAIANRAIWGPAIDGNVIVIGTDEVYHNFQGGNQLSENAVKFASDIPDKTGFMASLSCYYHGTAPGTTVTLLDPFGTFTVRGVDCYNDVHTVATHPALTGTTDATLSNWFCSVHEAFDGYPADFLPLAIAENVTGAGNQTFADGTNGVPYILVRGDTVVPAACGDAVVQPPEECDLGSENGVPGSGCTAQCKIEIPDNEAPDCSAAQADPAMLWPPNHKMKTVTIDGITDPDADPLTVTVTGITQDEPVKVIGSGDTGPDAVINPDGTVNLRAERTGATPHNGRVYEISVTATDPDGLSCERKVNVCVPHDMSDPHTCVDDGQLYDSTVNP